MAFCAHAFLRRSVSFTLVDRFLVTFALMLSHWVGVCFCRGRGLGFQGGFGPGGPATGYGDRGGGGYGGGGGGYGGGPGGGGMKRDYDGGDDREQKRMRY